VTRSATPRGPAANAQLALLLEVAGTPKPGNVDRARDLEGLRFEQFLAGAVGAREGLELAAGGAPIGEAFETAVAGMSRQRGGNTQFGCLLNLVPLVRAASGTGEAGDGDGADGAGLDREPVRTVCESTTVDDAAGFYRAFEHVDVAVDDPPAEARDLDVRRGAGAVPALRERGATLWDVMGLSADREPPDGNAREWRRGFPRAFAAADAMLDDEGPATDRVARAFLDLLAGEPDTLVRTQHGEAVAREVVDRAAAVGRDLEAATALAEEFVDRGINPGTTADVTAAATFVALERGLPV
jgi:triphosphoribosyl-dephospho-CoA synthase